MASLFQSVSKYLSSNPSQRLHLVLDLDETLINSLPGRDIANVTHHLNQSDKFKHIKIIELPEEQKEILIYLRPYLSQFLSDLS